MLLPDPAGYLPAKLYEGIVRARRALYAQGKLATHRLNAPVISVGNLTVGGTGKTPCVAFIARALRDAGYQVAILSRGYKRASRGLVEVSDGNEILCGPEEAGDEPYLLARMCAGVRLVVNGDRYAAGQWLEARAKVDAFILDDGFQHLRLARDLNLLLVDGGEPLERLRMVPLGRLREPHDGMQRADAVIVTRSDELKDRAAFAAQIIRYAGRPLPIFFAAHGVTELRRLTEQTVITPDALAGNPVAAVSGIARPARFVRDLERLGVRVVLRRDFADHHRYEAAEFVAVAQAARLAGAQAILTTEKDAANLPAEVAAQSALPIYVAHIEFQCEQEAELKELVSSITKGAVRNRER